MFEIFPIITAENSKTITDITGKKANKKQNVF